MFSLSAALIILNLSSSLLAHPPDMAGDTEELSDTVLRLILEKNGATLQQHKCYTDPQGSQQPCPSLACTDCHSSSWSFLLDAQETKQTKTLLTEDGQLKGQTSKGLADQSNQSQQ